MSTWSTGFVRPGAITVEEIITTSLVNSSQYTTLFVGAGKRYKQYQNSSGGYGATITREDTSGLDRGVDIFYSSVVPSANVVTTIYDINGNAYTLGTDFEVTSVGNKAVIQWIITSGSIYVNAPAEGITYVVNFSILKDPIKDYLPQQFFGMQTQTLWSGSKGYVSSVSNGEVYGSHLINGVTWGAEMANNNDGGSWYTIELSPYDETTLYDATPKLVDGTLITDPDFLTKIENVFQTEAALKLAFKQALTKSLKINVWTVIPCFPMTASPSGSAQYTGVNPTLLDTLSSHINLARSKTQQRFRVALLGAPEGADAGIIDPTLLYTQASNVLYNDAICYVGPSSPTYTISGASVAVDGSMLAAAISGILSNPANLPSTTLSGFKVKGFDSVPSVFDPGMVKVLGNAGVLMVDSETVGSPAIVMDLTTNVDTPIDSQLKYRRVADSIANNLNAIFKKAVINKNNPGNIMSSQAKNFASIVLDSYITMGAIDSYDTINVIKDPSESRQLDATIPINMTPDVLWVYTTLEEKLS